MRHVGPALGRTWRAGQAHHLRAQKNTLYACCYSVPVQQPGGGVANPLDDVRQAEDCFLAREAVRQVFQHCRQSADLLLGNLFRLTQERGDQCLAFDKGVRLATPTAVANFRVIIR